MKRFSLAARLGLKVGLMSVILLVLLSIVGYLMLGQALERTAADFAKSAPTAEKLRGMGMEPESACGNTFAGRVAQEVATYSQIAKALDLKAD